MDLPKVNPAHKLYLISASIITKIFLFILCVSILGINIDLYDYQNYMLGVQNIIQGLLPWAGNAGVYYPPLAFIPMTISYLTSLMAGFWGFVVTMWLLMAICDIITIFCIYWIALKLYTERTAFTAALLYATAISVAYYSLSKFDAFPVCVAMLAILFTVYGDKTKGYLASAAGLFVKLWPFILFPFLWIYNAKDSDILKEGKKRALWIVALVIITFGGMITLGYNGFYVYTNFVYCNTLPYLISQYLQIAGIAGTLAPLITVFRILLVLAIFGAVIWQLFHPKSRMVLLKVSLISVMAIIFLIQYRSPQYEVWMIPFAALLVANNVWGIITFTAVQILSFIEFPLAWVTLYVNEHYNSPWSIPFFTVIFVAYGILLWQAMGAKEKQGVSDE